MNEIKIPTVYSQWDTRWAKDILGNNPPNSEFDLYNYGCLITCLAMALEYYGKEETPRDLNEDLKDGDGFHGNTGLYNWGSVQRIFKQIEQEFHVITPSKLTDDQIGDIKGALDLGYPVMLQIDVNPKTVKMDMHFVLAIAYDHKDENNFTILDPLGGVKKSLKSYLGWFKPSARNTIESYTILAGDVIKDKELKDTLIDFDDPEGKRRTVLWYVKAWFDQKTEKAEQKDAYEVKLLAKDKAFGEANEIAILAQKEIIRKETELQKLLLKVKALSDENARLIDQNASLFGFVDLIRMALNKLNLTPKG